MSILKKTVIAGLGAAVVLGTVGASFADNKGGDRAERGGRGERPSFETIDANSDGKIEFAEFAAPMIVRFDEVDADKNGTITEAEVEAFADGKRQERMVKRIAQKFDVDGNNEVTKAELENRQKKMFALMDRNDDGAIEKTEMPERMGKNDGKRGGDRGGKHDKKRGDRG